MTKRLWVFLAIVGLIVFSGCRVSSVAPGLILQDETHTLDKARIERAAQPLLDQQAAVLVSVVAHGGESDLRARLEQLSLLSGNKVGPGVLVVYASLEPHYSELRVGSRFSDFVPARQLEQIRLDALNPRLRDGKALEGVESVLTDCARRVEEGQAQMSLMRKIVFGTMGAGLVYFLMGAVYDRFFYSPPARLWRAVVAYLPWVMYRDAQRARELREERLKTAAELREFLDKLLLTPDSLPSCQKPELESLRDGLGKAVTLTDEELGGLCREAKEQREAIKSLRKEKRSLAVQVQQTQLLWNSFQAEWNSKKARKKRKNRPADPALESELDQLAARLKALGDKLDSLSGTREYLVEGFSQVKAERQALDTSVREIWKRLSPKTYPEDPKSTSFAWYSNEPTSEAIPTETPSSYERPIETWSTPDESRAHGDW